MSDRRGNPEEEKQRQLEENRKRLERLSIQQRQFQQTNPSTSQPSGSTPTSSASGGSSGGRKFNFRMVQVPSATQAPPSQPSTSRQSSPSSAGRPSAAPLNDDLDEYMQLRSDRPSAPQQPSTSRQSRPSSVGRPSAAPALGDDLDEYMQLRSDTPPAPQQQVGRQQTGPSVRPKVRSQQPGDPPYRARFMGTPEPRIVSEFMDPLTGEPDPRKLRQGGTYRLPSDRPRRPYDLANLSRSQTSAIVYDDWDRTNRARDYLEDRGYQSKKLNVGKSEPEERFFPKRRSTSVGSDRKQLEPSRRQDFHSRFDPTFNRPLWSMGDKQPGSNIAPVGRQGFGPTQNRSMSMPDLSRTGDDDWPEDTPLEQFEDRFHRLKPKHRNTYTNYRDQIRMGRNPLARKRLVKVPSNMAIRDKDISLLSQMSGQRHKHAFSHIEGSRDAQNQRTRRREYVRQRRLLPPSVENKEQQKWLQKTVSETIPEEDEDEEDEE